MLLPTNGKQFGFWKMRRGGTPNITIANMPGISRQAVSRALPGVDEKNGPTLRGMVQANQVMTEKINAERGGLVGRSIPFKTAGIIFVPEKHGTRVWYEHDGDCGACQRYTECIELLRDYATGPGIRIGKPADPAKMAEGIFMNVKALL